MTRLPSKWYIEVIPESAKLLQKLNFDIRLTTFICRLIIDTGVQIGCIEVPKKEYNWNPKYSEWYPNNGYLKISLEELINHILDKRLGFYKNCTVFFKENSVVIDGITYTQYREIK